MVDPAGDLDGIGTALRTTFPDVGDVMPLRLLGSGFRSIAVETPEGIVFRIARNQDAAVGHAKERRLLPALQDRAPVAVPNPQWFTGPSPAFPFGVIGYPKLLGTPLSPDQLTPAREHRLAADIAGFILALHRFPVEEALPLGLPTPERQRAELATLRDTVLPALRSALTGPEHQSVTRWWDEVLADPHMSEYRLVLQHGDLWYENVLVDEAGEAVVSVVDFERAGIGDPAQDFATQFHLGPRFAAKVIGAYQALGGTLDGGFRHRLRRLWELREFDGVWSAMTGDDPTEVEDAVRKLRRGPVLGRHAGVDHLSG